MKKKYSKIFGSKFEIIAGLLFFFYMLIVSFLIADSVIGVEYGWGGITAAVILSIVILVRKIIKKEL